MGMGSAISGVIESQIPVNATYKQGQAPSMNYGTFQQPASYQPPPSQPMGKGGNTYSPLSGQPRVGQPNSYANTVGQWDNASQQLNPPQARSKGKGA